MSAMSGIDIALWDLKGIVLKLLALIELTNLPRSQSESPDLRAPRWKG